MALSPASSIIFGLGNYDAIPSAHTHRNVVEQMDNVAVIKRYHVEQFAKGMALLEATEDGEWSRLDNSMIV